MWKALLTASAALALISTAVLAQPKPSAKPRSAESFECSKQADAKGLQGKVRKKFRSKCMRDLRKKAA
jgi:hypothetical protein